MTATDKALLEEAHLLRKEIVEGLTNQAPGGTPILPLAATTLAARQLKGFKGTKALLRRGDLRNSISVTVEDGRAFVGVSRKARNKGGAELVDVARIQEFGAGPFVVPLTPKSRRFLFAVLRKAGSARGLRQPSGGGGGRNVVVIQIRARPFLRPAFEAFRRGAQARFLKRVARHLGLPV